ncbi:methyltransferase domain-containing protein [Alteromonas sp. ASW11-36]|uniref:Malonyl-[acyl-carrier protein] O-methyltransferase n=1 Tax=Alteromonas arenosi TaxID=3055817 RepID=A0ABT7SUP8_9ALTE|nr:methyltransferase domain-containing protein [Alteromonas sp. ASW11-36]MDM7859915.1 methyltransferase domain-containing protein [Alteromonas sp. ASW11-36]
MTNLALQQDIGTIDKSRVAAAFSRSAQNYAEIALVQRSIAEQLARQVTVLPITGRIMDLGCGTGYLTRLLKKPQQQWLCVDLASGMLEHASKLNQQCSHTRDCEYLQGDMEALPITENLLDTIVSSMALQWAQSPQRVCAELKRTLKPQGQAYLAILRHDALPELRQGWQSIGQSKRVNQFATRHQWLSAAHSVGLKTAAVKQHDFVTEHTDIRTLLHSIRGIGAGVTRSPQLPLKRNDLHSLQRWWQQNHARENGLQLTYSVDFYHFQQQSAGA